MSDVELNREGVEGGSIVLYRTPQGLSIVVEVGWEHDIPPINVTNWVFAQADAELPVSVVEELFKSQRQAVHTHLTRMKNRPKD